MQQDEELFASIEEKNPVIEIVEPKKATRKRAKKESRPKESGEDWSNLSLSTLKRKTVKDLTAYLDAKVSSNRVG